MPVSRAALAAPQPRRVQCICRYVVHFAYIYYFYIFKLTALRCEDCSARVRSRGMWYWCVGWWVRCWRRIQLGCALLYCWLATHSISKAQHHHNTTSAAHQKNYCIWCVVYIYIIAVLFQSGIDVRFKLISSLSSSLCVRETRVSSAVSSSYTYYLLGAAGIATATRAICSGAY